jgi:hypothetical protein
VRCGARYQTAPFAVSWSARHSSIPETSKTRVVVLITQRSRVQIRLRYQEVQVRGLIARGGQAFLIFVAAWWQQDRTASGEYGRQESADIGHPWGRVVGAPRSHMVWARYIVAWPVAEGRYHGG